MKKVITLDSKALRDTCLRLEAECIRPFEPDVVLGIESGGRNVADMLFPSLPHCYVALRRPSTRGKGRVVKCLLRHLPRVVADWLRVAESSYLERHAPATAPFTGELPPELAGAKRILVADDAVDSGNTMLAVVNAVKNKYPDARVAAAAVVVTTEAPVIRPDFYMFDNLLIRFPWSADVKK
ncbi:MAG: phosphoribosyltransferase domain-containing protein [Muribaculaceae bacterium]|nr:phosphoribosyltransferase domain-containing protein [Muribaculaceae bacterium]